MNRRIDVNPSTASEETIQQHRERIGLSRIGLAYLAGVDLRTIERIEAGDVEPRRATLAVISAALEKAAA